MMRKETPVVVEVGSNVGRVSGLLLRPESAWCLLVLAHGAGAGMRHQFLEGISRRLADGGVATLRYHFPYVEQGRRRPDAPAILVATVRAAVGAAGEIASGIPVLAGGKSLGGRMTSMAAAEGPLPAVRGIVFLGFPLHPPGKPSTERADHLEHVRVPMLFLQGTRDAFAGLDLLRPICHRLGDRVTLHEIEGADHGFHVPRAAHRTDAQVLDELALGVASWARRLLSAPR
jgi:predicted alpha/beta-hydrolase family hydrolase